MQRTFREVMFLQDLNNMENIIRCALSARMSCASSMLGWLNKWPPKGCNSYFSSLGYAIATAHERKGCEFCAACLPLITGY